MSKRSKQQQEDGSSESGSNSSEEEGAAAAAPAVAHRDLNTIFAEVIVVSAQRHRTLHSQLDKVEKVMGPNGLFLPAARRSTGTAKRKEMTADEWTQFEEFTATTTIPNDIYEKFPEIARTELKKSMKNLVLADAWKPSVPLDAPKKKRAKKDDKGKEEDQSSSAEGDSSSAKKKKKKRKK